LRWNNKAKLDFNVAVKNGKKRYLELFDKIKKYEDTNDINDITDRLLKRLKYIETISQGHYKLYFSGSDDPVQNKFESLSNELEICVICKTKECASILLEMLHSVITQNKNWYIFGINAVMGMLQNTEKKLTITNYVNQVVKNFEMYGDSFNVDDKLTRTLIELDIETDESVHITIEKDLQDVDLWNYKRVSEAIKDLLKKPELETKPNRPW
jgi:hypothetical protein